MRKASFKVLYYPLFNQYGGTQLAITEIYMRTWIEALGLYAVGAVDGGSGERRDFTAATCALESSEAETWTASLGPRYVRPRSRAFACTRSVSAGSLNP